MLATVLAGIFQFFSAAFRGVQGGIAYSFGTPERRKLTALAVVYLLGFLAIERATVGWNWFWPALLDTAYALIVHGVGIWIDGDKPITITPGATVRQSGPFSMR